MPARDPNERQLIAAMASNTRWALEPDRRRATAPARAGLLARFEREADPDGQLTPNERAYRAEKLLQAHMLRMSLKAATARRRKREAEQQIREAETALVELGGGAA